MRLLVVPPHNRMYLLEKYAPVIFGRTNSASSDTQLLTYGNATPLAGGSARDANASRKPRAMPASSAEAVTTGM